MSVINWEGISYPFRVENGGIARSRSTLISKDGQSPHIAESIRQICTTMVSERIVNPELGVKMRPYQFANMNGELYTYIAFEVKTAIEQFDPRVQVVDVIIDTDKYAGKVDIAVQWKINEDIAGTGDTDGYMTEMLFDSEGGVMV